MAEISAAAVMKLRKMSGQGMMDCKKALTETNGDIDAAMAILRKKGLATMAKRADRETTEGKVICKSSDDGKTTVMVSLCCETDFVSKNDDFVAAANQLADYALVCDSDSDAEVLANTEINGRKYADIITETVSKTGEKTEIGDFSKFTVAGTGLVGSYIHFNDKSGGMVEIETDTDATAANDELKQVASDICMHITAVKPLAADRNSIDPATIEQEKAIAAEQVKDKPANIIDKIVEGKMNKFFADNCLVDQKFVKNEEVTVQQVLDQAAKKAGGTAKIKRFVRFDIG